MKYLLPASTYQRLYYYKFKTSIYFFGQLVNTVKKFSKANFFSYRTLQLSYFFNLFIFYFPKPRKFRRICWFNSKSHWVSKRFNFSRGYSKKILNSARVFNYKPRAW